MASDQTADPQKTRAPAVHRTVQIIERLAAAGGEPQGPSALARDLGIAKSSVLNICGELVAGNFLRKTPTGYTLGHRLLYVGEAYLGTVDLVQQFHEVCTELERERTDTIELGVLGTGLDALFLARRYGNLPIKLASEVGQVSPANCTAVGKALLATLSERELDDRLRAVEALPVFTPRSIDSPDELRTELVRIRNTGFAVDRGETLDGVVCVARALHSRRDNQPSLAVGFTALEAHMTDDREQKLLEDLRDVASTLALRLGLDHHWGVSLNA